MVRSVEGARRAGAFAVAGGGLAIIFFMLVAPSLAEPVDRELARDDGKMESKRTLAGSGHIVSFDRPAGQWQVRAVRVFGVRSKGAYDPAATFVTVTVMDEKLAPLGQAKVPCETFKLGEPAWVEVPFEKPIEAPARFKVAVVVDPAAPKGIYVGFSAVKASASGTGLPGGTETPFTAGKDWMVRAILTGEAPAAAAAPEELELKRDDGVKLAVTSFVGSAYGIDYEKPAGDYSIRAVKFFVGRLSPSKTKYTVAMTTMEGQVVCSADASCADIPEGDGSWVTVPFKTPGKCPDRFRIRVEFNEDLKSPEPDLIMIGFSATKDSHSWSLTTHSPPFRFDMGEFMIRAILCK